LLAVCCRATSVAGLRTAESDMSGARAPSHTCVAAVSISDSRAAEANAHEYGMPGL